MTNDDRFDELLQEAAREHNSAPETPRAEMWAAIAAARGSARAGAMADAPATPVPVRVIPLHTRNRRALNWVAGLAATLLVGVAIGRMTSRAATDTRAASPGAPPVAASSADDLGKPGTGPVIPTPGGPSNTLQGSGGSSMVAAAPDAGGERHSSAPEVGTAPRPTPARREATREAALPYRVAAMQHLVTTEALLVSLRSDVRAGRKDTTIATWAGELLGTTRMLMDSPAGRDPKLKQLLEDLELVLAQISRLPGAQGEAADLGLIDDAVRHRQIMTRLRALAPET